MISMTGNVMTHPGNSRGNNRERVLRCLFASLVFVLGLLMAAPFFAVLMIPVYITFYYSGLYYP